jgi:hypothetical protein
MRLTSRGWTLVAVAAFVLTFGLVYAQASDKKAADKTLIGTVTDTMCGARHMMSGASDADCTRACVKQGSSFALLVGKHLYTLQGDKDRLYKLAGQQVKVTGTVTGDTVQASSIEPVSKP